MSSYYTYVVSNPNFENLGYLKAIANIKDKHDRSAPSNYHWKILKCRMIIFSASSILSCPDKSDVKQIHIIFNKTGNDYDRLVSLFLKFSLIQDGVIHQVTTEEYSMCFLYTMTAKLAPVWNYLGPNYYINNRDFLKTPGSQDGIKLKITVYNEKTILELKSIKIYLAKTKEEFSPGETVVILPSLNKAVIEEYCTSLPKSGDFKCYKDIRRHWKNIHGYRLPEEEHSYYSVRFWRGEPLTYPEICVLRTYPIITPVPTNTERIILSKFITSLKVKISNILGFPLSISNELCHRESSKFYNEKLLPDTQAISLCTPTQN
ncbi:uncharacterized protein C18orf63-like [Melitaea cinxia]|uniref:uncharacterized protein C18orf63-like n=1 Tax=Melitaea cinxia TaxID=113334 RepID=UPI001E273875|nr:uncharacterized protein C18orf63-like [Melitaea cinxia]